MASAAAMTAITRDACAGCDDPSLTAFLDLGSSPLADRYPAGPGEAEDRYPLRVAACSRCGLAQLLDIVPDSELYGADYGFRTGASPALAAYYQQWAAEILAVHDSRARAGVIEIGCNDGTLLRHFADAGCPVLGIDPSAAAAEAAAAGLPVITAPFTAALPGQYGVAPAGLVIACNVAAHVADPLDFLTGVRALLAPGGAAVIEFQYLADLLAGCMLDHVYHEHRFFYSLRAFTRVASAAGLQLARMRRTAGQGGSLRVTLVPAGEQPGLILPPEEARICSPAVLAGMQARADYAAGRLRDLLAAEARAGRVVAGYGATAKSATLLNFARVDAGLLPWIEDLTPGKIGRRHPGTGIPVVHPDAAAPADTYLLLAWNYAGAVLDREREFRDRGGRFIIPGAVPVVI